MAQISKITMPRPSSNHFWIPGFEGKYSLRQVSTFGLEQVVYSWIYPGMRGKATPLDYRTRASTTASNLSERVFALTRNGYKYTYGINGLITSVQNSDHYAKASFASSLPNTSCVVQDEAKNVGATVWVIGRINGCGQVVFSPEPKQHKTQQSAYDEAERLAAEKGGTFAVFRMHRQVTAAKVVVKDF